MKNKKKYSSSIFEKYEKELEETDEVIDRMREDVFGHRVTSYSPKDTHRLKNKLNTPIDDVDKEKRVAVVEPLMARKSIIPKFKDPSLDSFLDIDTRVSQKDFDPTIDLDMYKKKREKIIIKPKDDEKKK
jgi:hypothetical protein